MRTSEIANVTVGKPDTYPSKPSHQKGVREGNARGQIAHEPGVRVLGEARVIATGRRSTGINAKHREPIDPRMPILTPA